MKVVGQANYAITMEYKSTDKKAPKYLGSLKSNITGTRFNLYDDGESPSTGFARELIRNQCLSIIYHNAPFSTRVPNKLEIIVPKLANDSTFNQWKAMTVLFIQ